MGNIFKNSEVIVQSHKYHMSFNECSVESKKQEKVFNDAFESNIDLNAVKKEAEMMIADAQKEAERIINAAKKENELKYSDGFESGKQMALKEYQSKINEAIDLVKEMLETKHTMAKNHERDMLSLVESITYKIIGKEIQTNYNSIKSIFENAIVKIIEADYELICARMNRKNISMLYPNNEIEEFMLKIKCDKKLKDYQCILETENGDIDISFSTQLSEIKNKLVVVAG
ncbi:MAG: hypothetical protein JXQ23_14130 [Clostridia bacterium]|nr:hypothetical protein [Clostridia bacterium]